MIWWPIELHDTRGLCGDGNLRIGISGVCCTKSCEPAGLRVLGLQALGFMAMEFRVRDSSLGLSCG